MALFSILSPSGVVPKISKRKLGINHAQIAENCYFSDGDVRPFDGLGASVPLPKAGPLRTVFLYAGLYWFHWAQDVNIVPAAIANNNNNRVYYTGDGQPKMTDDTIALAGGTQYPMGSTLLSIPPPSAAPTHDNPAASDPDNVESRRYEYTLVRRWNGIDEETRPSPASLIATVTPGQAVTVTTPTAPPSGAYTPTGAAWFKRIYRTNSGTSGSVYQRAVEIPVSTPNFVDTLTGDQLGLSLITEDWDPPSDTMQGLVAMPNGIYVGFSGLEVMPSVAYQPHAFPISYRQISIWPVVALAVTGQSVVVGTTGQPYLLTGVDPAAMSMDKIDLNQACVSKRSMVDMGDYVIYASPDGLVAIGPGIARVITSDFFTEKDWKKLNPSSIHGYHYDGKYIGFYDTGATQGGFVFDPSEGNAAFSFLTVYYDTGYNDLLTDSLYLVLGQNLSPWDSDPSNPMTMRRRTGVLKSRKPTSPGSIQVFGNQSPSRPLTFRIYADGVQISEDLITDTSPIRPTRLIDDELATDFEIEIAGTTSVSQLYVGNTMRDLQQG